ncbi:MAG TPA: peptide deformylase [Syntrophorhabdaceae bacterium]
MALRKIAPLGCPTLRMKASSVDDGGSPEVRSLIEDMMETLADSGGVGIAAPQVDVSLRLFIMVINLNDPDPGTPGPEAVVMINPLITGHSDEIEKDWEGCLSIPGIRGVVPRFTSITIKYTGEEGAEEEREFHGFAARVCQHEYDHLEGLTYLDRLEGVEDIVSELWLEERSSQDGSSEVVEVGEIAGMASGKTDV